MYQLIDSKDIEQHKATGFITIYLPMTGHKAVQYWWNPSGFWEPWETGMCAFESRRHAYIDAKNWAKCEEMPLIRQAEFEV